KLDPAAMEHTVKVLRRFRKATEAHAVERVRVVATSPLRDASNARTFMDWVRRATGWTIEVISGLDEGRLIRLIHSLPLGAVRLTQAFLKSDPPSAGDIARLRGAIAAQLDRVAPEIRAAKVETAIATSGTAATLAAMRRSRTVTRAAMREQWTAVAGASLAERRRMPGIGSRRAEIIVAGAALFSEVLSRFHLRAFRYSPLGLRDGMLAEMASAGRPAGRGQLQRERRDGLVALGARYGVDAAHAERVRRWALDLFRRLRPLHHLPAEYAEWIGAAAMVAEIGYFVNRSGARRHSQYLVAHSEIVGFSPSQRAVIAALVRHVDGARPILGSGALARAVLLLRLARALDQGRRGAVSAVRLRRRRGGVEIHLKAPTGALEAWAVEREAPFWRDVLGTGLRVRTAAARR